MRVRDAGRHTEPTSAGPTRRNLLVWAAVLAAGLLLVGRALAADDAGVDWWVLAGGGAPSTGGSVALNDTLGQPIIGPASGGNIALEAGYWSGALPPTVVELASFSAAGRDGAITVAWEIASETDLLGFDVYRQAAGGELVRLNEALIPCQKPGSPAGASYEFVDEAVVPGVTYWYWLDVVDNHSGATRHGPVMATVPAGPAHRIYLPLVGW